MKTEFNNIFNNIPSLVIGEDFSELLNCQNVVIERIVSSDKPDNIIYNQPQDEWVILLRGKATLQLKNDIINLTSGDYLFIPGNTPHQVIKTSFNPCCIWLAIHITVET
jgi:cupin 2 domain-containing protein